MSPATSSGAVSSAPLEQGLLHSNDILKAVFHLGQNSSCVTGGWENWAHLPAQAVTQTHGWGLADACRVPNKTAGERRRKRRDSIYLIQCAWIIRTQTWLNTEFLKGREKRSAGRQHGHAVCGLVLHIPASSQLWLNHLPRVQFISCGFSRNMNPKTRCTESLVHGIKASIRHVSSVSEIYSFCLLLSSDYNLLLNNTLMIFSMPIYFLSRWLGFLRQSPQNYINIYINTYLLLKRSLTTYKFKMTSTRSQSTFGTRDLYRLWKQV